MRPGVALTFLSVVALIGCVDQPTVPPDVDVQFNATGTAADKTVLCHKPGTPAEGTLEVAAAAVEAHLGHGDVLGECAGGNPNDVCTALNDPGYDGVYAEASLSGLIPVGDEKINIFAWNNDWATGGQGVFAVYFGLFGGKWYYNNFYWYPNTPWVYVEQPNGLYPPPSGQPTQWGGWRITPTDLGWGHELQDEIVWTVSCAHCPDESEPLCASGGGIPW